MKNLRRILTVALSPCLAFSALATTRYVDVNSANPTPPYANWATAANVIQAAVDAAEAGEEIIVTNGAYATGGRAVHGLMTNRVAVDKAVTLRSVNGPEVTIIQGHQLPGATNGDGAIRCVYLTNGAFLTGFTLTSGATRRGGYYEMTGGAVWCVSTNAVVSNCFLTANAAAGDGGGAFSGTLKSCLLTANLALYTGRGGGAFGSTICDCTLAENSAYSGGGAYGGFLSNSSLARNVALNGGGANSASLSNCTLTSNSAGRGGGAYLGALEGCRLIYNQASVGGGAWSNTLNNCELTGNYSGDGGGVYRSSLTNCTLTGNWAATGGGASASTLNFCVLMGNHNGAGGEARREGGGAYLSTLSSCTLSGNMASLGGGAYSSTLDNCVLTDNYASSMGGGAYACTLRNCTLVGNSGNTGGGVSGGGLNNCILYENSAEMGPNYASGSLNFCCTTPLPAGGVGNICSAPLLVDLAGRDARLRPGSPCINAGNNAQAFGNTDCDGHPRIAGGTVDMGAYEFQSPASTLSYAWAQQFGLPTDGSADFTDSDRDGHNNWQEWRADTVPTNASSRLTLLMAAKTPTGLAVTWQSVATRRYLLERNTNFARDLAWSPRAVNIPGQLGTTTFSDTATTNGGPFFYRVAVE